MLRTVFLQDASPGYDARICAAFRFRLEGRQNHENNFNRMSASLPRCNSHTERVGSTVAVSYCARAATCERLKCSTQASDMSCSVHDSVNCAAAIRKRIAEIVKPDGFPCCKQTQGNGAQNKTGGDSSTKKRGSTG